MNERVFDEFANAFYSEELKRLRNRRRARDEPELEGYLAAGRTREEALVEMATDRARRLMEQDLAKVQRSASDKLIKAKRVHYQAEVARSQTLRDLVAYMAQIEPRLLDLLQYDSLPFANSYRAEKYRQQALREREAYLREQESRAAAQANKPVGQNIETCEELQERLATERLAASTASFDQSKSLGDYNLELANNILPPKMPATWEEMKGTSLAKGDPSS